MTGGREAKMRSQLRGDGDVVAGGVPGLKKGWGIQTAIARNSNVAAIKGKVRGEFHL